MALLLMKWMFRPIRLFFMVQVRDIFICVVNLLLTIITLGIYLPWALMKCSVISMLIWKLTDNDFLMGLPVGMFCSLSCFCFFYFAILMTVSADMPLVGCV